MNNSGILVSIVSHQALPSRQEGETFDQFRGLAPFLWIAICPLGRWTSDTRGKRVKWHRHTTKWGTI